MLRLATLNDFDTIYMLYMDTHNNPFLLYEPMEKEAFLPIYKDLVEKKLKYVLEIDGVIKGMCKLIPQPYRNTHVLYLGGVAVVPDASGKGYGTYLIQEVLEIAKAKQFHRIELTVACHNKPAISLYKKLGFEQEGILKKFTYLKSQNIYIDEMIMAILI